MIQYSQELQTAIAAAKVGGKIALKYYETSLVVKRKMDNSLFTDADTETEKVIKEYILKLNAKKVALRGYEHAYALSLLAKGSMDLVIDSYGTPWDYAPFVRIITEARGKVTDFEGKPWNLKTKNLLATNGLLHNEVLQTINQK